MLVCSTWLAFGQNQAERVQVTKSETGEFPAGGTLRLEKSVDELWIEGWDQPGFDITTTKTTRDYVPATELTQAKADLERVRVTCSRQGRELIVRTESKGRKFDLEYRIHVPRTAALVVEHHTGGLQVDDVSGNVKASVSQGLIMLRLPADRQLAINAKSTWGSVTSDFRGISTTAESCTVAPCSFATFPFGHRVRESATAPQQELYLRVGFGDILIMKENNPGSIVVRQTSKSGL